MTTETRAVGTGTLTRDREHNVLTATGVEATFMLARVRELVTLPLEDAQMLLQGVQAQRPLWLWAIEGAYAEHLGDFSRWMFTRPTQAILAGDGDREAARSLEPAVSAFQAEAQPTTARRASLLAQVDAFGLLSEPLLAEKRDALRAFDCPALARWTDAARALCAYFKSEARAGLPDDARGPASAIHGVFSLDFPANAPAKDGVELHRFWAFCEAQFIAATRNGPLPDGPPGFFLASQGLRAKLRYRNEDGVRQALYAAS